MADEAVLRALRDEIRALRAEVERLRNLPADAFVLEGLLVDITESRSDGGPLVQEARLMSTEGSWSIRQVHHDPDTDRWWTSVSVARDDVPVHDG